ncbi:tyrosine-sulfated glycopeptide receptor 1-like [Oryza brachyantha]|uniref:non-specific serine/threonine protein kinase n=1 Tax=Oryza brachyantha TaxID=4533 RepID=J3L9P0_ORYBR|nr:tyrosine-sulfated glycopeptide receptor 1-like [Oryza brachyantha]
MQRLHFWPYKCSSKLPIPSLGLLPLLLLISLASLSSSCTEQEKGSLHQFLAELSQDGDLSMSWRNDRSCCAWEGITCNGAGVVTEVSLGSRGLEGNISASLGNLTGLLHLNLSHNSLSGYLPWELVSSSSINVLDVSFNRLTGELKDLPSPADVQPLKVLNISSNAFTGQFPSTTWKAMKNLAALNASNNSFTGEIPAHFCSSSRSLTVLDLCYNLFSGGIPPGLGACSMLKVLKVGQNNLTGTLPDELFNATSLEYLSFPNNCLDRTLDSAHIVKLSNLVTLDLGGNKFNGRIPESIGELKKLEELYLGYNNMYGEVPLTLTNCTNLKHIDIKNNNFSGELSKVNFSTLHNLQTLDLTFNNFNGTIPESIYSCSNLIALRMSNNKFYGQLSKGIGNLKYLSFLSISNNSFTNITDALQLLKNSRNLTALLMGVNFMGEVMPGDETIDGFENLQFLTIDDCSLLGKIPFWFSNLANLQILDLSNNQLTGQIPVWINRLNFLFYLDVSNNSLTGGIPTALMERPRLISTNSTPYFDPGILELPVYLAPSLQYRGFRAFPASLNLARNHLIGAIPEEIGQLKMLRSFNISFNSISGEIPQLLCNLTDLQVLDLSNNHLIGTIPAALNNMHFLSKFNVSNNDLEGPIPTGGQFTTFQNCFEGNPKLCGSIIFRSCDSSKAPSVSRKHHNKKAILAITLSVFVGGIVILLLLSGLFVSLGATKFIKTRGLANNRSDETASFNHNSDHTLVVMPQGKGEKNKLTFADIMKTTNNFDKENIIGCGGYGLVYKADLPDGSKLAIKKLNTEMCLMEREFTAEIEALTMAQHDNLVPLWGYCIHRNSRLLIYSYMENGSLDDWLHNRDDDASSFLDWPTRLKIAQGASLGISYIHVVCKPHIVHRDIKSSNILLDKEFKAYIADFGLSRLILPSKTHVTTELVGTLGYIPPEYGQAWVATLRGDIYSFGVVLLELLTGRRPVPFLSTSKELVPWVQEMTSEGKQIEVLDPAVRGMGYDEQMLKVLEIASKCVNYNPLMRPTIMEVVASLDSIDPDQNTLKR